MYRYILATHLLAAGSSATVMNLSLLTSDFWSVVVGVLLLGSQLNGWCASLLLPLSPRCRPRSLPLTPCVPVPDPLCAPLPLLNRPPPSACRYALAFALVVGGLVCYHWKPRREMCGPLREPLNAPSAQECVSPQSFDVDSERSTASEFAPPLSI